LHLSPEDIAAAEACGINFLPASEAQVQRLAMQRKVFYRAGEPILATRGDGLFETAGTLQQLIEEGRRQQRDLTQWLQAAPAEAVEDATATLAVAPVEMGTEESNLAPAPEAEAIPSKRPRQRRRRVEVAKEVAEPWGRSVAEEESEAARDPAPPATASFPSGQPWSRARSAPRDAGAATIPVQERGKRWLVAGAARRGRAGKHWSTRQR
jgi:hypothetical protein